MSNVIDEEECKLINDLKEVKDAYKEYLEKFKQSKVEISSLKSNLEVLKVKYVENFESWFYDKYGIRIHEHNDNEGNKVNKFFLKFRLNMEPNMSLMILKINKLMQKNKHISMLRRKFCLFIRQKN